MRNRFSWAAATLVTIWTLPLSAVDLPQALTADELEFFETRIRPLLSERCYACHSTRADEVKGGLLLDSRAGWMRGGDRGDPVITPGRPELSVLLTAVAYTDPDLQMPPKGKLAAAEIAALKRWIELGAPDPRREDRTARREDAIDFEQRRREHWCWRPIERPQAPPVSDSAWAISPIDRHILAHLEAAGLSPAADAERSTLLRRISFDLVGLPPTLSELNDFLADHSPDAYDKVVDRLLSSPRFPEKWAQHWLDLVRYAETRGHESDYAIPHAFRYRDYVLKSLSSDVPFDTFVIEHIAGDLVEEPRLDPLTQTNESILGTGFWHLGEAAHSPVDIRGEEADRVANQIDVFSKTFLGLSIGCARCHDHKFDAITTQDYYALCGYLQSSGYHEANIADPKRRREIADRLTSLRQEYEPRSLAALHRAAVERTAQLGRYLVAAVRLRQSGQSIVATEDTLKEAAALGLDRDRIERWSEALKSASEQPEHPLFPLAVLATKTSLSVPQVAAMREKVRSIWNVREQESADKLAAQHVVATRKEGEHNDVKTERPWRPGDDLIAGDVDALGADRHWLTAGHRFGDRAASVGSVVFGRAPDRPIAAILTRPAVCSDLSSDKLTGLYRTPTFEVVGDKVWYRFSGKADVFLAVDSHRVVHGPLHRVVKQHLDSDAGGEWFAHSTTDYIGHRVHIEFTSKDNFRLERVVFSETQPVDPAPPNERLRRLIIGGQFATADELAEAFRDAVLSSLHRMARSRSVREEVDRADAELAQWLVASWDLLGPEGKASRDLGTLFLEYQRQRHALESELPEPVRGLALLDGSGEDERVHIRGNHKTLARHPVGRRNLAALGGVRAPPSPSRGSGRLALAHQIASPANPLVARVAANRVWHHLFGRGIVPSVDDFGVMGQPPSHPELLDYLAVRLIDSGWSLKTLVREIVTSRTYRMASRPAAASADRAPEVDPTNQFLHHMPLRRLTGEALRDAILHLSGRLDRRMLGPSVMVHITPYMRGNRSPGGSGPIDGDGRRSVYIEARRNHLSHFLVAFDKPIPFSTMGRRSVSNSPAQPLILLNDPFVHQQAKLWAARLLAPESVGNKEAQNDAQRVAAAYLRALSRRPHDWEQDAAIEFLQDQRQEYAASGATADESRQLAWADFCHTLFNVKEFVFLR